jgi:hypothetical protein
MADSYFSSRPVGCRDHGIQSMAASEKLQFFSKWRRQNGLTTLAEARAAVWSGTTASYFGSAYTQRKRLFGNSTHVLS